MALKSLPEVRSKSDLMQSVPQSKAEVTKATRIAEKIVSAYPDYGKAPDGYLLSVTEFIAYQIPEVQDALAHPVTGIASKCKYLPTIADLKQFIEDRAKRLNTRATGYRYFKRGEDDPLDIPDAERRKAQVIRELGYDPAKPSQVMHPPLAPAIIDAIEENRWSSKDLKTPAKPISPEFRALLIEQGVLQPLDDREEQAA
jgi:hypothetical protein